MNRRLFSITALTIMLALLLGFTAPDTLSAAKKRAVDQLQYPDLNHFQLPEIHKAETANGIKLRLIKDDKLPLVALEILLKGGNAYEPPTKIGLAAVTSRILRIGGTKEMKCDDLEKFLDNYGITITIIDDTDNYRVSLDCLKDNLDSALGVLAQMLQEPAFDEEKIEEIKTQLASAISRQNDTPDSIRTREFNKLLYGENSPFAAVISYEDLDNISTRDIMAMHRAFFAPDNMLLGVVGPLEADELQALIEKHFGQWNHHANIPPFPGVQEPTHDFKVAFAEKSNLNQGFFSIGHLGTTENLEDKAKIMVFNSIFSTGFDSRLNRRIRVKMGLTYGAGGGIMPNYLYPGTTFFTTYTKSESTLEAIKAIFDEINIIRTEKVTDDELKKAKDFFQNSFVFNYSTPGRIMFRTLQNEFYGVPADIDNKMLEDIKKITAQDILDLSQKYLHPDKMMVFVVGNGEKIKEGGDLATLGKVKTIDITIKPPALKEKIPAATPEMLEKGQKLISTLFNTTYKGYKQLKSMTITNDIKMTMMGRSIDIKAKTTILYPDKQYSDMSIMGGMMKVERIINGKKGVMKQMGQQKPMGPEEIEKDQFGDLDDVFRFLGKDKYSIQYLKEETVNGKVYEVIYIFDAQKHWVKFFVNKDTRYIEMEEKMIEAPGQSGIGREIKSDFKTVSGIPFPFKSETYIKDKLVVEATVSDLKVNPPVDPAMFNIEEKK